MTKNDLAEIKKITQYIIDQIATGRHIADIQKDENVPFCKERFYKTLKKDPELQAKFIEAREKCDEIKEGLKDVMRGERYDYILGEIAAGRSVMSICRDEEAGITRQGFYKLARKDKKIYDLYIASRKDGAEVLAEQIVDIADNIEGKPVTYEGRVVKDDNGKVVTEIDSASVAKAKLMIDARKWNAVKLLPKMYGDKLETEHTGDLKITKLERHIVDPANKDG